MAKDPSERYPSAGDLGQAALEAAGGLRRASPGPSVVATGEAARAEDEQAVEAFESAPRAPARAGVGAGRPEALRWAIALAGLLIVAVGMVAALNGISTL